MLMLANYFCFLFKEGAGSEVGDGGGGGGEGAKTGIRTGDKRAVNVYSSLKQFGQLIWPG